MDAGAAKDERRGLADGEGVWFWHRGAGVKFPRSRLLGGDGGKKAVRREEHVISSKPSRREDRIASASPVCSCAHSYEQFAHGTAGAARTRSSLRPLPDSGGGN